MVNTYLLSVQKDSHRAVNIILSNCTEKTKKEFSSIDKEKPCQLVNSSPWGTNKQKSND